MQGPGTLASMEMNDQMSPYRPFWKSIAYATVGLGLLAAMWAVGWISSGAVVPLVVLVIAGSYLLVDSSGTNTMQTRVEKVDTALAAAILDSLPDPVVLLDKKRGVLALNQAAIELMGEEAKGRDLSQSFRHPAVLDGVNDAIAGRKFKGAEVSLTNPVRRTLEAYATPFPKGSISSVSAILVLHDVTLARQAEEMRGDFVANVSHELRSPLSSLVGFIETLQGPAKDDAKARQEFLGVMEGEAGRMARLIDDLLSLARIEVNEHVRPLGVADVSDILHSVIEVLSVKAEKSGTTIELEVDSGLAPVPGDADELTEVFQNLVDNAIKYGAEGEPVSVRVEVVARIPDVGGAGLVVRVTNRGEPIAPEHLPRLTERFYRVDKGRSRQMGGTGLGLAIVKHIVARHRGRLVVESGQKTGTVITIYLPVS